MGLEPGRTLAHYRLVERIGHGGMGEVWRAIDTTLDREVAVKLLPPAFADEPDRLARFEREAKVLASLNHPGIAQIYGFHAHAGGHFLAMELVRGEDLAARLARGPLPMEEALQVARQVAEALEEAHEHGVVHRDLKPANVVIAAGGGAKVLDFGLAKVHGSGMSSPSGDLSLSPTLTSAGTQAGVILGTAAYMSPEQARGKAFDRRTDIWSFGCLLYEALTGERLFRGETISDTIALILQSQPDESRLPAATPPRLRELLGRCLQKDARSRLRDIGEARIALGAILEGREWETSGTSGRILGPAPARARAALAAALVLVGAALGAAGWSFLGNRAGGSDVPLRVSVEAPAGILPDGIILTADGRTVLFVGTPENPDPVAPAPARLFARRLDRGEAVPVPGTEGAALPAVSPDGRWLAYVAPLKPGAAQRRLYKAPLDGGAPPLALADWDDKWSRGILWVRADRLLVSTRESVALRWIPSDGSGPGESIALDLPDTVAEIILEDVLPDGEHLLATSPNWDDQGYHDRIFAVNSATGASRLLLEDGTNPRWAGSGHLVFSREDALLAVPFDPGSLEATGGPVPLADGLRTGASAAGAAFDLSEGGTLIHQSGGRVGSRRRLVFVRPDGELQAWSGDRMSFIDHAKVSPDGRTLATTVMKPDDLLYSVWTSELDRPRLRQWLALPRLDCTEPVWLPDGRLLANCEGNTPEAGVYLAPVDRSAPPRFIWKGLVGPFTTLRSVHPRGNSLLMELTTAEGPVTLRVPLRDSGGPFEGRPLFPDGRRASAASFSPDGRYLAYISTESGRSEIQLAPLRDDGSVGASTLAGTTAQDWVGWIETGIPGVYDLLYGTGARLRIERMRVHTNPLRIEDPALFADLSQIRPRLLNVSRLPDGRLLAIQEDEQDGGNRRIDLVLNFEQELRRLTR